MATRALLIALFLPSIACAGGGTAKSDESISVGDVDSGTATIAMPTDTSSATDATAEDTTSSVDDSGSDTDGDPPADPPSLEEFWNGDASFVYQRHFTTPSDDGGFLWYNVDTDIEVVDGAWYLFSREFIVPVPAGCADSARVVVRRSDDQGKTWSDDVVVVDQKPNTPTHCAAVDGDAFYDAPANRWHFIFQCNDGVQWAMCHAVRDGMDPVGTWAMDPMNPVVSGGDLWNVIAPGAGIYDEGTPGIIDKIDGAFYVGFHGFDGVRGYRGLARTPDFDTWEPLRQLFGPADCPSWNVPWLPGGCIGGGAASTAIESPWTYMLIEAADISLGCTDNQHWVFGMLRTNDLLAGAFEPLPGGPALLFGTHELKSNGATPACSVQYTRLFRAEDDTIWLALSKGAVLDDIDADPVAGRYLYRLERDAPIADYPFRIGPGRTYVASETISRGDLELGVVGSTWMPAPDPETYALTLAPGAALAGVDAAALDVRDDFSLRIDARIDAFPMNGTSLLAGKVLQYWLEVFLDGELCGWVMLPTGPSPVCAQIDGDLGAWHQFGLERAGTKLRLLRDGVVLSEADISAEPLVPAADVFRVSNQAPNVDGFYGPISGAVDRVTIYDHIP